MTMMTVIILGVFYLQKLKHFNDSYSQSAPNLLHLRAYADVFEELIDSSPSFHFLLQDIKVFILLSEVALHDI